jgi:TonB family protein
VGCVAVMRSPDQKAWSEIRNIGIGLFCLLLLPITASANDILGTNIGIVATDSGVVQVPCNLIGTGPLRYPPKARRYKYIGQVIVKFGVDEKGNVTDPFVVASEPPGVFERAALSHVKTYKYLPPVFDNGVATHVDEVAIKLVFDPNRR